MAGGATDMHLCAALPVAALATILVTIAASCSLAISAQHIPPWPQISMCGMYPPERYVFSMGFTVGAGLLAMLLVINHVRNDHLRPARSQWSAEAHLGVGLSSTLCLALMATVPVSEFPVPHVLFAVFFFLLVLVFQAINSVGRVRSLMGEYARLSGGEKLAAAAKEAWMLFWMAACFIGFALWQVSCARERLLPPRISHARILTHAPWPPLSCFRPAPRRIYTRFLNTHTHTHTHTHAYTHTPAVGQHRGAVCSGGRSHVALCSLHMGVSRFFCPC